MSLASRDFGRLKRLSRRSLLACAGSAAAGMWLARAAGVEPAPAKAADGPETRTTKIKKLQDYYAKVYGEPLTSPERLPRQIAIISLSRIDAPATTERLLEGLKSKDRDPVILYLAWEALHARHNSLSTDKRYQWAAGGLKGANLGAFPGATVAPLLLALAEHSPVALEGEPSRLALRVLQENDLKTTGGKGALDALRDLVTVWHDPRLIRGLIAQLNRPELTLRIDHVLRGLPDPPAEGTDPRKGWIGWGSKVATLTVAGPDELKPYSGKAVRFAAPKRITDPDDPQWRAELEITKLTVSDLDLVWCIDSTGSMNEANQLVAAETGTILRVCALVSRRARCGTIYFRHETDAALMQHCCTRAKANSAWYQVKGYPLTTDILQLSTKMAAEKIPKPSAQTEGNVHPGGAFHAALKAAMEQMTWSKDARARKVIVLVGDSPVTPGSETPCEKLTADAKAHGFQVHALARGSASRSWAPAIAAGGGRLVPVMRRDEGSAVFNTIAITVVREAVAKPYQDRVEPLVNILLNYARAAEQAEQTAKGALASKTEKSP